MNESPTRLARWDETDLVAPLTLDAVAAGHFRNRHGDANLNGRSYGGQSLGQAPIAAASTVAPDRVATMMQLLFLQGTVPDEPIDFAVATLQDGKRFSSRQVRGTQQGGRAVFDAQVSFAVASPAPEHAAPVTPLEATPEDLRPLPSAPWPWETDLRRLGGYSLREKPCMDCRVPEPLPVVQPPVRRRPVDACRLRKPVCGRGARSVRGTHSRPPRATRGVGDAGVPDGVRPAALHTCSAGICTTMPSSSASILI